MKQDMRSVWDYSIARWQKRVRFAEHDLTASGSLRFLQEKIRYPPGADLPDEEQAIVNHEPAVKSVGIRSFKVQQAKAEPDAPRYALNGRHRDKTAFRILAAYCCDVVETPKRNPIVNPQKKNLKLSRQLARSERLIRPVAFVRFAGYFETLGSNRRRVIYTKREVTNGYFWYIVEPPVTVRTISISLIFSWFTV